MVLNFYTLKQTSIQMVHYDHSDLVLSAGLVVIPLLKVVLFCVLVHKLLFHSVTT